MTTINYNVAAVDQHGLHNHSWERVEEITIGISIHRVEEAQAKSGQVLLLFLLSLHKT